MAAVRRYDVLDTPPDGAFDRITALAARRFGVPISIISIVDTDRIWFKSHHGLDATQIGRDPGLCASAILTGAPHILTDASADPRSLANPLVAGEMGLRFYAGVPLTTDDGFNLGTLCVIDTQARPIDDAQIADLTDLASLVVDQLELQMAARRAVSHAQLLAREIDHRVSNSLQFISSLLTLQSRDAGAAGAADHLKMAANRVLAMVRVHRHFYANDTDKVSCLTFIRRLCADLSDILGRPIEVDGDEAEVSARRIQPIGLLVNELVTNAAKHGAGTITVRYAAAGDEHVLTVCDDGAGFPPGFDPAVSSAGLGMKVIATLARQLGGQVNAGHNPAKTGACMKVLFPA